jgi:energy-converting hydrogenase Eha subunit E
MRTKGESSYIWLKTAGLLAVIPVVLVCGPIGGYLVSDILVKNINLPVQTIAICVILGFVASVLETIRIIRLVLKFGRDD